MVRYGMDGLVRSGLVRVGGGRFGLSGTGWFGRGRCGSACQEWFGQERVDLVRGGSACQEWEGSGWVGWACRYPQERSKGEGSNWNPPPDLLAPSPFGQRSNHSDCPPSIGLAGWS